MDLIKIVLIKKAVGSILGIYRILPVLNTAGAL
jgi:hypothetical protein